MSFLTELAQAIFGSDDQIAKYTLCFLFQSGFYEYKNWEVKAIKQYRH